MTGETTSGCMNGPMKNTVCIPLRKKVKNCTYWITRMNRSRVIYTVKKKYPLSDREFKTLHTQSMFYQIENIKQDIIGKTVSYFDSEPIEETMIYANEIPQEQESIFTKAVSIYKQIVKVE